MQQLRIVGPDDRELQVSQKAFDQIYKLKGFRVIEPVTGEAEPLVESVGVPAPDLTAETQAEDTQTEQVQDGAESNGQAGEPPVSTDGVSEGPGTSGDQGSVRPRGRGKGSGPAGK